MVDDRAGEPSDANPSAFKLHLNAELVERLATVFDEAADDQFDAERFRTSALDGLDDLELKARIRHIAAALGDGLPDGFLDAAAVLDSVLALAVGDNGHPAGLDGWESWPIIEWIGIAGREHPDVALGLLARSTSLSSAEFAIRPYIDDDPVAVLAMLDEWAASDDEHVRRLVSEGTRPKLPWGAGLAVAKSDPLYAVTLLDRLVDDDSEYVRRSVSNHLNDLCRVAPAEALGVASRWSTSADAAELAGDAETAARVRWVVARGIRTLVKSGDPAALRLLGFDPEVALDVSFAVGTPSVRLGGAVEWELQLRSLEAMPAPLVVDYLVHFVRSNGTTGPKVFKWSTFEIGAGEERTLVKRHKVVPITTRTYYSGRHRVEVQVNGRIVAEGEFDLST